MTKQRLVVIGGGVTQCTPCGKIVAKHSVVDYLTGLSTCFESVIWVTRLARGPQIFETVLDQNTVSGYILSSNPIRRVYDFARLSLALSPKSIMLLYLPAPWLAFPALLAKSRLAGFFVYIANDYIQHSKLASANRGPLYSYLYRKTHEIPIRHADGVIARGPKLHRVANGLNSNTIETIPIGLQRTSSCIQGPAGNEDARGIMILYVGKILRSKGLFVLMKAYSQLKERLPSRKMTLNLVGNGPDRRELESYSEQLGLKADVHFLGYVDDPDRLSALYAQADIVVVPSTTHPEGVPRVIDEALLHRKPVIASALSGIAVRYCNNEVILVDPGSNDQLANELHHLILDDSYRKDLAQRIAKTGELLAGQPTPANQHANFIQTTLRSRKSDN